MLLDYVKQLKASHGFPGDAPMDPARRGAAVAGIARDAPEYSSEVKQRVVASAVSQQVKAGARALLREHYTRDDRMACQACHEPMPFKVNGQWYFEAVEVIPGRKRLHEANYLALCPLCAAMYKNVREPDDEELMDRIDALDITSNSPVMAVPIALDGTPRQLLFTGKHALDLQTSLGEAGEARP